MRLLSRRQASEGQKVSSQTLSGWTDSYHISMEVSNWGPQCTMKSYIGLSTPDIAATPSWLDGGKLHRALAVYNWMVVTRKFWKVRSCLLNVERLGTIDVDCSKKYSMPEVPCNIWFFSSCKHQQNMVPYNALRLPKVIASYLPHALWWQLNLWFYLCLCLPPFSLTMLFFHCSISNNILYQYNPLHFITNLQARRYPS